MKTVVAMIGIFLTLVLAAPIADAQTTVFHYHCYYRVDAEQGKPATVYSSQIIASDKAATTISRDWEKYILATYPEHTLHASGTCRAFGATPEAQQFSLNNQENSWRASNLTLVHVVYSPDQGGSSSPASPAPTALSAPTGLYLYCSSDPAAPVVYFSEIFAANPDPSRQRGASFNLVKNAFLEFLQQKYAFNTTSNYPIACPASGNPAQGFSDELALKNAQANRQRAQDQVKQQAKQIVETGWKYSSGQGAETPTQAPAPRMHH
jgi:hypothetical protein